MSRELFAYPQTQGLLQLLDEAASRSAVSRGQAFEDFLEMSLCALSGGTMEEQYLAVVEKHADGEQGKRGCDSISALFGKMVAQMEAESGDEMIDPLGDLFQGAITYGESGQFLTPMPICRMVTQVTLAEFEPPENRRATISDPCCGSGRMLLAAAEIHHDFEFHAQDIDSRCVKMTAINLALRNLFGYVAHGDTLRLEERKAYRTGFNGMGVICEIPVNESPTPIRKSAIGETEPGGDRQEDIVLERPSIQRDLF